MSKKHQVDQIEGRAEEISPADIHVPIDEVEGEVALKGNSKNEDERVVVTVEDDKRLRRKTDKHILVILVVVYFWQIYDKAVWGHGNVYGLSRDLRLQGNDYSLASSFNAIAQIVALPASSYLIVRVPSRYLMTALIFGWGVAECCLAASVDLSGLLAGRFFLGFFEAACLPLFSVLTAQWYRRSEQPVRVAAWYCTNGPATMIAALVAWACGKLQSDRLYPWQLIYLTAGLATVSTAPFVYYFVDSDIASARFFTEEEKGLAYERLRANQTGAGSYTFKWSQCLECFLDPKTYVWMSMSCLLNIGASVTGAFGPTLINNFGFATSITSLLNIPFGFLQFVVTLGVSYFVLKARMKSPIMLAILLPVLAGLGMLYSQGVSSSPSQAVSLAGYYLLGILFGGNTVIVSWMIANTAGQTKKTVLMVCYNIGSSIGNIVGPLLFNARDRPTYLPGIRAVLGIFIALFFLIIGQTALLYIYNLKNQRKRVALGKPKYIVDTSMSEKYQQYGEKEGGHLGDHALEDVTDLHNEEFLYVY